MKIVCATNMPFAREAFSTLGDVTVVDGRAMTAADVRHADILATRSTTKINRELLDGSRVRFAGTATIGTDHMDIEYLDKAGITWCSAAGCNANSVSEYLTSALLHLAVQHGLGLQGLSIGVIGVGNVGTRVVAKACALGMRVLPNDPPRERNGEQCSVFGLSAETLAKEGVQCSVPGQQNTNNGQRTTNNGPTAIIPFVSLDEVLARSDIVTFHVPLTQEGNDATSHMADRPFFELLKPGAILINAARGPVLDTDELLRAMDADIVRHAVIDTWEGEPDYRTDLLERADIGTPHIAGHSFEGKYIGTLMVYREVCKFLGVEATWTPEPLLPVPPVPRVTVKAGDRRDEDVLWDIVGKVYDITADDRCFRETLKLDRDARVKGFDSLRKDYPIRREFRFTTVSLAGGTPSLTDTIAGLGFNVERS